MSGTSDLETLSINTIRTLAMDAVQAANSGHPGTPMGMAPTGYVLWQGLLSFDPDDPIWPDRKCPGHPEYRFTSGVETTTGPLGQGLANSVGMAVPGRWLATHYNKPGF